MPITFAVTSQPADRVRADLLAVPVFADRVLGPGADIVDAAIGGSLGAFMEEAGFEGKSGDSLVVPMPDHTGVPAAVLVGLGERQSVTTDVLRRAAAVAARQAARARLVATTLLSAAPSGLDARKAAQAVAEGFILGAYRFLEYKTDGDASKLAKVNVVGGGADARAGLKRGSIVAAAVSWARDMVNEPSGAKSPAQFAAAARRLLAGRGVTVTVMSEAELRNQRMGGVLGVGQGSSRPPRFVRVVYRPRGKPAAGTLALVGKGVVFDSGGLSLKTASGMETMKTDMSGAAAVLAAMSALQLLDIRHRVVAYAPMVENMPSGSAIRPGDVVRMRNGTTVEVLNTDAEGRLILADALALATSQGADAVVDLATLTGACVVALGEQVAGVMGEPPSWVQQVQAAADRADEPVWPLPLPGSYRKMLESEVADLRNIGTGSYGGALTAGLFLQSFVAGIPWVHLDIAGPARASADDGELIKGGTGFGVRTLLELVSSYDAPGRSDGRTKHASGLSIKRR